MIMTSIKERRRVREKYRCSPDACRIIVTSNTCRFCGGELKHRGNPRCMSTWYVCGYCIEGYCRRIERVVENEKGITGGIIFVKSK